MCDSKIGCEFCDAPAVLTNCKFVVDAFTEYAATTEVSGPLELCRKCFDQHNGSSLDTEIPVQPTEEKINGTSN